MGHYYTDDPPAPFYEVPYADKTRAGELRPVTIKDAKKVGAYPSPNEVMGIIDKPGLLYWKLQHMSDATHQTVIELGGNWDTYGWSKSYDLYKELTSEAASKGTEIHDAIEQALLNNPYEEQYKEIITSVLHWLEEENISPTGVEEVFVSKDIGIGGKIDVVDSDTLTIVDWKTIDTLGKKLNFYTKDKTPLMAAYSMGVFGTLDTNLWNVFISRDEPGKIIPKLYTREEIEFGWRKFYFAYKLWTHERGYDPRNWMVTD
jgi:hypothetical protein